MPDRDPHHRHGKPNHPAFDFLMWALGATFFAMLIVSGIRGNW